MQNAKRRAGRHFLHIPGPTPVPDRILGAMAKPTIDHRSEEFAHLARNAISGMQSILRCDGPVLFYPASGTGAWEAALVNLFSPGDLILTVETGHFAALWARMAGRLGLKVETIPTDWRRGADPAAILERLANDSAGAIKAVCLVHNETSTGCATAIPDVRRAIDAADHPALLMVDTISSLASMNYRHDDWGVDVTVGASQKGLMLPPGLSFNALSERAVGRSSEAGLPASFWSWGELLTGSEKGFFPYTPATNMLYGLVEAVDMLHAEGLDDVFARHDRLAEATRRAVRAWGLELLCEDETAYSSSLTAIVMPKGHDADDFRRVALASFDISLGAGLGRLAGKVFRIGHLGDVNDLTIVGALAGVEMALARARVPHREGGVTAAMHYLAATPEKAGATGVLAAAS